MQNCKTIKLVLYRDRIGRSVFQLKMLIQSINCNSITLLLVHFNFEVLTFIKINVAQHRRPEFLFGK